MITPDFSDRKDFLSLAMDAAYLAGRRTLAY
jgi:hypothetical protein